MLEVLRPGLAIGGKWIAESSGGTLEHINPATGEVQQVFPLAGPEEVDQAVRAARAACRGWGRWTAADRRRLLQRIAGLLRERTAEFGRISTLETGLVSPFADLMAVGAAEWFDYYAGWTDKLHGEAQSWDGLLNYTLPEPVGVVAIILTWNGPTGSIGMKVAAALAAGCTVVLKPPELAPFSSNLFAELCMRAGLPEGVLNVVPGGPDAGEALVAHPVVDKISFTGGPETAKLIQASAARSLTPLLLELGGKSANLVFADADVDTLAVAAARAVAFMNGQLCVAPTRLLVEHSVYDRVVERAAEEAAKLRPGDPFAATSDLGPVINKVAHQRILAVIERAKVQGQGELVAGGFPVGDRGYFIQPTVFRDVDNGADLAQKEVFGPVLAVLPFEDEDEAIALANDSAYGLAAYINTNDLGRAHRVAAELDVGNIAVNGGKPVAGPYAPFGGFKDSGYGKEGALAGVMEFIRIKNVNIKTG
ncbi:aldehyde dehydrogenase family protein [Nocardia vinacea]|uniref:aldehyde dehydrogenase family protein n=1 Tax=Nocardia vinacea TaxID=96468 RepID=UPI002E2FAE91|nr:aldehyde dehydrogenase family protein [Nocardia vinacea]